MLLFKQMAYIRDNQIAWYDSAGDFDWWFIFITVQLCEAG